MWTLDDVKDEEHGLLADTAPSAYKVIEAANATAGQGMQAYLIFMAVRLLEMKRLLRVTGSLYLQCDPNAGHYLRSLMDAIFGRENFRNEIVWAYRTGGNSKKQFARKHDLIYFYSMSRNKHTFNPEKGTYLYERINQNRKMAVWSERVY